MNEAIRASQQRTRVEKSGRVVKVLTWALGVLLAIGMSVVALLSQYELDKLADLAADTKRNSDRLVDCTTPGGKCYEQGRDSTRGAIGTINKATAATVHCSARLGPTSTLAALTSCVTALVD